MSFADCCSPVMMLCNSRLSWGRWLGEEETVTPRPHILASCSLPLDSSSQKFMSFSISRSSPKHLRVYKVTERVSNFCDLQSCHCELEGLLDQWRFVTALHCERRPQTSSAIMALRGLAVLM